MYPQGYPGFESLPHRMKGSVALVKTMYPCQDVPVVIFNGRCSKPCLYCDLYKRPFSKDQILASGLDEVLLELAKHKGAYFSAVTDCFLEDNRDVTHYLIENIWKSKKDFVPLVVTKQSIPQKTINLFAKNKDRVVVQVSVPSLNQELVSILEPGAALIAKRLESIEELTGRGVKVLAVVMPWFNVYGKDESIDDLPTRLARAGVERCILGTGVLPPEQRQKMLDTGNELVLKAVAQLSEEVTATTKIGYTMPFEERNKAFTKIIGACKKAGIKARICTADNPDLIGKTDLPLCTRFKHHLFVGKNS